MTLGIGARAPGFKLTGLDGERYSLDDNLTLAIFFKTSCPTCQLAWPFYERLYKAYKGRGLEVWGISQHDREKTRQYASNYAATFPHLVDEDWKVSRQYDPEFVPTGFLIGRDKKIIEILVAWDRAGLNRISTVIASRLQVPPQVVIRPDEDVVVFKPG